MKATLMLADWAQALNGKLYIMGGGWSITGPDPAPSALAIKLEVPWDETNRQHTIRLALIDDDAQPVIPTGGDKPLDLDAFVSRKRWASRPPTASEVRRALEEQVSPAPIYRESSPRGSTINPLLGSITTGPQYRESRLWVLLAWNYCLPLSAADTPYTYVTLVRTPE